jgi:hypothetical protein
LWRARPPAAHSSSSPLPSNPHDPGGEDHLVLLVGVPASRADVLEVLTDRAVAAMGMRER